MNLLPPLTDRDEFVAWRAEGIGASDIAGILGLSPWESPWSIWAAKSGQLDPVDMTDAMAHGLWAEHSITRWYAERTGLYVGAQQWRATGDETWMRATLDGLIYEEPGVRATPIAVIECKATGDSPKKWAEEGVPEMYACQATWQSIVTGLPTVVSAVLHVPFGRMTFETYEYTPDDDDRRIVLDAARDMWRRAQENDPPDADAHPATTSAIRQVFPGDDDSDTETVWADEELDALCASLRHAKADQKAIDARVTELENRVKVRMGDSTVLSYGEQVLATWKPQTARRLDLGRLRAERPEIADEFTTTTTSRVFRLKTPKGE